MLYRFAVSQKVSNWTPFVVIGLGLLASLLFSSSIYADNCALQQSAEKVDVDYIYDGDTLRLTDKRKIRLIGINTPEHGRGGKQDEPFYIEAKTQLKKYIQQNHHKIKIVLGKKTRDRYKRNLAHLFSTNNQNITEQLLKQGLGFVITISPNLQYLDCYIKAEEYARKRKLGIWNHSYSKAIQTKDLKHSQRGFHRIRGTVIRISESKSSYWLNLDTKTNHPFAIRLAKKDLKYFKTFHPKDLLKQRITARGWIYPTKNENRMNVHHPASLKIQKTD